MTFNGDTIIGKPTLAMVEIYIAEKGLFCEAQDCYDYWEAKNWLNQKGKEIKTLEQAINSYNEIVVFKTVKKNQKKLGITKLNRRDKQKAKRKARKELLAGNKGLENLIKLESFVVKKKAKEKESYIPYDEQLKDKKWEAFRKFIFAVRGKKCEKCGSTKILQVHHPKYVYGRKAWEYTCNEVMVLCKECHEKVHNIK